MYNTYTFVGGNKKHWDSLGPTNNRDSTINHHSLVYVYTKLWNITMLLMRQLTTVIAIFNSELSNYQGVVTLKLF